MQSLSRAQLREIDRLSIQEFHIPGVVLMENAARAAINVAIEMITGRRGQILILAGGGNNGGDGLAIARHFHNHGCDVQIFLTSDPAKYAGEAAINWKIVQSMGLATHPATPAAMQKLHPVLVIDAIFGTGLSQPPREPFPAIAKAIHQLPAPVLAIDIPSGLDCDTGLPLGPACVRAHRTISFVAPKLGYTNPASIEYTGPVTVGDIGCPRELIARVAKR